MRKITTPPLLMLKRNTRISQLWRFMRFLGKEKFKSKDNN